ncbi:LOW QUALITY PROTEIN: pentatricopeptide repeat-containing protein At2g29760, chloroplastic-like [Asparagus officinalis]|uniref:LOW QUALITY PROTEIN: pentatricopeptide repeat-containing protein At2g29760, chloroplastic-like n=1 Tax=Asparagus officinalis TaxID=4686 RepID=UPI00098DEF37|nr:LOW QUALITY PROTEIN: pentatricopeptide repeat-containing protein At2g29760, chloroplastic-like [Asparagus officinalis]
MPSLFDQIPQPNLYAWNILIRPDASSPFTPAPLSLALFSRLLLTTTHLPDNFTFPFAIRAASVLPAPRFGAALHAMVFKSPPHSSDVFVLNSLVHFYASCADLNLSFRVFSSIPHKDVVSWNSIITAFSQGGRCDEALELFRQMKDTAHVRPNDVTMVSVLSACAMRGDLDFGRWLHSYIRANDISDSLILNNAILDMYVKCGSLQDAKLLFDQMVDRDSITWTTLLVGYAKSGEFDVSRRLFNEIPSRDIACWNALISGYEQNDRPKDALALFSELKDADERPDQVTLVAALSACAQLGAIDTGCWIHAFIRKNNFHLNFHLTTSLIDMYSKCGELEKAVQVFESVDERDVFVWSAMIGGFAMYGRGRDALGLFLQMQQAGVKPNKVTFTNILCACSHAGLVEEGRSYFSKMLAVYGIAPDVEHYGCMVDILGRAGLLDEARDLIENMPMPSPASAWGALLGSCVVHKDVQLGELACKRLLELEPANDGAYILLSNLYAKSGKWDSVARLRKLMKDRGLKKEPGCSSIQVHGVLYEFLVGDVSHPQSRQIYLKLEEIMKRLKTFGYVPNKTQLLQNIEDEHVKEQALYLHSEKLAIAFGLISTSDRVPIRIAKNMRICEDCHSVAKLVSKIYNREIFLRDRYRFHHFKGGRCSCVDYW